MMAAESLKTNDGGVCADHQHHDHDHDHQPTPMVPRRQIFTVEDMDEFKTSASRTHFLSFISALSASVQGKRTRDVVVAEDSVATKLVQMLEALTALMKEAPPEPVRTRFGNQAFRVWLSKAEQAFPGLLEKIAPAEYAGELTAYLANSFGHMERIDYGTGHETHFAIFLFCLDQLHVIAPADYPSIVLRVFTSYVTLMRKLQLTYWLEPAGSHGIWGLDDYHFLPFLFGSSQLIGHKVIKPKSVHNKEIVDDFAQDYMYLDCIMFINSVKTESLQWHSPMLNDISGVKTWNKVNEGMIKMYTAEVLGKLPVAQHFLFGSLFRFEPSAQRTESDLQQKEEKAAQLDHYHDPGNPNCCPRVPSAIAASASRQQQRIALPMD